MTGDELEASEASSSSAPASSFGSPMRRMGIWFFTRAKRGGRVKIGLCHLARKPAGCDGVDSDANGGGSAIARYGVPEHLRSDNGPELIAYCIQDWLKAQEIKTLYIKPGSPWENGHIESFHDKLRDECLNRELFGNLQEARVILAQLPR